MGYDRWYLHVDADERLVFDGARRRRPAGPRPRRRSSASPRPAASRRLRGMLVDLYPPGPLLAPEPRRAAGSRRSAAAVRRRRLRRGALPRAGLAQGRAAAARLRLRPRADQVPAVPHPRRRGGLEPAPPAPLPRELPLGLLPRAPARQVRPRASAPRPSAPPPRATTGAAASSTARRWPRSPATPGCALAYPGSRRYRAPADLVAAGLIAPIPWAGRRGSSAASPAGAAAARWRGPEPRSFARAQFQAPPDPAAIINRSNRRLAVRPDAGVIWS